ncbi:MAG: protein-ER retention protein [Bogoriella megaspora]|nr:MAG: protein-ER retention protein [Bogoriella megaspora]
MDGDVRVGPELDTFSLLFPLPYRVALIIVLGVWAWGANLQYLSLLGIDVPGLIRYPSRASSTHPSHALSTNRLAFLLSIPLLLSLLLFWAITHLSPRLVIAWDILPALYLLLLLVLFALPTGNFRALSNYSNGAYKLSHSGRYRTLNVLKRVSIGGLAEASEGKFGDILMADVLTSYAKVLGDLFVALCMFFSRGRSATGMPDRGCGGEVLVPLVIAVPSVIRLRQCLIEYVRVRNQNRREGWSPARGWGGQHLANALKYSSAFPVIVLSALQRSVIARGGWVGEVALFRLWLFFVFINSFYSFYWDVAKDWDLTLFSSEEERDNPDHPWGLRRILYFGDPRLYYAVIALDLFLRCTWSLKLSPHLDHFNDLEGGIFTIEVLEVFRRWVWVFFRVEAEWIRNNRAPAQDDVLLGELHRRDTEDRID